MNILLGTILENFVTFYLLKENMEERAGFKAIDLSNFPDKDF